MGLLVNWEPVVYLGSQRGSAFVQQPFTEALLCARQGRVTGKKDKGSPTSCISLFNLLLKRKRLIHSWDQGNRLLPP